MQEEEEEESGRYTQERTAKPLQLPIRCVWFEQVRLTTPLMLCTLHLLRIRCENCNFFIGPCMASLFIRNCKDCNVVAAVQQLRTRDVKKTRFRLYSQTRPIIEKSGSLEFR